MATTSESNQKSAASLLNPEDYSAIKGILLSYREEGVADPLLPADVDLNADGLADSWALDENDEVVIRYGTKLEETVYVSDGDDAIHHETEA